MSYKVLALKYRPTTFDEVVGQTTVTRTLRNAIEQDRIGHAFLLSGARGVGKTTTARILAKALNCSRGEGADRGARAASATRAARSRTGQSLDVQEIDGATNNSVDQVRELRESARYNPARDRFKIWIIDEVHMLSAGGLQRAAEDAGGAAAAGEVHLRHHRVPQDPGDDPLPLPAVRLPDDPDAGAAGAPAHDRRAGGITGRRRRPRPRSPAPPRAASATRCRCSTRSSPSPARR